jgi:hypothetical protein
MFSIAISLNLIDIIIIFNLYDTRHNLTIYFFSNLKHIPGEKGSIQKKTGRNRSYKMSAN